MTIQAQLADGRVLEFPDGTDPNVIQSTVKRIISAGQPIHQQETPTLGEQPTQPDIITGIPSGVADFIQAQQAQSVREETPTLGELEERALLESGGQLQTTESPDRTIGEQVKGAGEATRALTLGGVAGLAGGALGSIEGVGREVLSGEFGSGLAEETAQRRAEQFTKPFAPKAEAGEEILGGIGEALEPLGSLPPIIPGGAQASMLAKPSLSQAGALSRSIPKKFDIKDSVKIAEEVEFPSKAIGLDMNVLDSVSTTKPMKLAAKQGFDEGVIKMISLGSRETKETAKNMLKTLKNRMVNPKARAILRTTDSVGANVVKRYKALKDLKKTKGAAVEKAVESIKDMPFNLEPATDSFFRQLNKIGVRLSRGEDGAFKANYSNVDATNRSATEQTINSVLDRINRISSSEPNAGDAHKLKKLLQSGVEFGELPTAADKLAGGIDKALKDYAHNLNEGIRGISKAYAKANDEFRSVRGPLSEMDKAFRAALKVGDDESIKAAMGTKAARTLMSNMQSRGQMLNTLDSAEKILKKNNVNFADDLIEQAVIADELERVFGTEATTSLSGQAQRAGEQASLITRAASGDLVGAGTQAASKGVEKILKSKSSQKKAIEALERILNEQPQQ